MSVKKAFVPIVELLEQNAGKKVKDILDDVKELCQAKGAGGTATTVHRDEQGNVVAIRCYYFRQWMPLSHVDFGAKANSASGYNTMCKEGVSNWTKQQREFRKGKEELLSRVGAGEISPDQINGELERLEAERTKVIPKSDGIGFETLEECLAADPNKLDKQLEAAQAEAEKAAAAAEANDNAETETA